MRILVITKKALIIAAILLAILITGTILFLSFAPDAAASGSIADDYSTVQEYTTA